MKPVKEFAEIKPAELTDQKKKPLSEIGKALVFVLSLAMVSFHLYTALFGVLDALLQRSLHFTFALVLIFLLYRAISDQSRAPSKLLNIFDASLIILSLLTYGYIVSNASLLAERFPFVTPLSSFQLIAGMLGVLLMLEACRRTVGVALPVIAIIFIIYTFSGPALPGLLSHSAFTFEFVIDHLFYSPYGVFGRLAGPSATFLFVFLLFGSLLQKTGGGAFFIDLALSVAGKRPGGPAKAAVVASSLMGTVIGSPVANVLTTGTLTIPLMKKAGYRAHYAAGVEAAASTGGQITPPLMGTAAFMMAEMLGIPYLSVVQAAVLPAFLYFLTLFIMVDNQTSKLGLAAPELKDLPNLKTTFSQKGEFALPIAAIIYVLLAGYSPLRIATVAVFSLLLTSYLRPAHRLKPGALLHALSKGASSALPVIATIGTASIVVSLAMLTGISTRFAQIILSISSESMLLSLILIMLVSIIFGLGLPTLAAYLIQVPLVVPVLLQLGVEPLVAHFFVLFFAVMSNITPPIAIVAFAAAGIAAADPNRTGFAAWKLASTAFIIPFMFVYGNALLTMGSPSEIVIAFLTAALGCFALASAVEGFLLSRRAGHLLRLLCLGAGLALMNVNIITDLMGVFLLLTVLLIQRRTNIQKMFPQAPPTDYHKSESPLQGENTYERNG